MYLLGHHHGSLDTEPERVSEDQVYVHLSEINGKVSIEVVGRTGSTLIWSEGGFTWPYHDRSKQERWKVGWVLPLTIRDGQICFGYSLGRVVGSQKWRSHRFWFYSRPF